MVTGLVARPIRRIQGSFSLKLLVLFSLVVLLVGGIGGVIYVQTGSALERSTADSMERSTVLQANTLASWVDRGRDRAAFAAGSAALTSGDESSIATALGEHTEAAPEGIVAMHYVDAGSGEIVASSMEEDPESGYARIGWSNTLANLDDTTLTAPYEDPTTGDAAVAFVASVSGTEDGRVVMVADLAKLSDSLERPATSEESFTHVVDASGTVVVSQHAEDINEQNMGHHDEQEVESMAVKRGLAGETGQLDMQLDAHGHDATMSMGYAPVAGTDWVIMTHIPAEEAYVLEQEITQSVLLLIASAFVGLGLIGVTVGRNTSRSINQLVEKAHELEQGSLDGTIESDRSDEIGELFDAFDSMRCSLKESFREAEAARERAEQKNEELEAVASQLEAKADEIGDVTTAAADGDLTCRMDTEGENETMVRIAHSFNDMVDEMERTIAELRAFSDQVASHSEEVTASSEEIESASESVSASVQDISKRSDRQHEQFESVTHRMEELSGTTEEIASLCDEVASIAQRTAETGQGGREAARRAIEAMNAIDADAEAAVEEISTLHERTRQVEEIAESIADLAEQTNMLALNANIEASRTHRDSDDAGFGAVAEEVKKLAEETKEAAEEIETITSNLRTETDSAVEQVTDTKSEIADRANSVEAAVTALSDIADFAEQTHNGVAEITTATQNQAENIQEVVTMVEEAAAISEAVSTEAESVASAAEEQTSAISSVTASATGLSKQAQQLRTHLDAYEIDTTSTATLDEHRSDAVSGTQTVEHTD